MPTGERAASRREEDEQKAIPTHAKKGIPPPKKGIPGGDDGREGAGEARGRRAEGDPKRSVCRWELFAFLLLIILLFILSLLIKHNQFFYT